jgi:hypothetical protein
VLAGLLIGVALVVLVVCLATDVLVWADFNASKDAVPPTWPTPRRWSTKSSCSRRRHESQQTGGSWQTEFASAIASSRRVRMCSLVNTLPRCRSMLRALTNKLGADLRVGPPVAREPRDLRLLTACSSRVSTLRVRTVSPVAGSPRRARLA